LLRPRGASLVSEAVPLVQPSPTPEEIFAGPIGRFVTVADVTWGPQLERGLTPRPIELKHHAVSQKEAASEEEVVPYLALVRSLLESDQVTTARKLFEALPVHLQDHLALRRFRAVLAPPTVKCIPKQDIDRTQEYVWLQTEGYKYRGQWIALDGNQLVASAQTLQELRARIKPLTFTRRPLIHRVD